jgi:hypothetical protein
LVDGWGSMRESGNWYRVGNKHQPIRGKSHKKAWGQWGLNNKLAPFRSFWIPCRKVGARIWESECNWGD